MRLLLLGIFLLPLLSRAQPGRNRDLPEQLQFFRQLNDTLYVAELETAFADYAAFMAATGVRYKGLPLLPDTSLMDEGYRPYWRGSNINEDDLSMMDKKIGSGQFRLVPPG